MTVSHPPGTFYVPNEASKTFKMELFATLVNGSQQLTIFAKHPITDVWVGSECASAVVSDTPKPVCNGAFSFRIEDESQKSRKQHSNHNKEG